MCLTPFARMAMIEEDLGRGSTSAGENMRLSTAPYSVFGLRLGVGLFFSISVLLLSWQPLHAALAVFELKDATRDTGWAILYDNTQVSNPVFVGSAGGTFQGRLTLDKRFDNANLLPIDIEFIERPASVSAPDHFGLRISLTENVTNNSSMPITAYEMRLVDNNPVLTDAVNDSVDSSHPGFAHFHNLTADGAQNFNPFTLQGPRNPPAVYNLGQGTLPSDNDPRNWTGIGIHQIHEQGQHRNFILRQSPNIPEPAALALLGLILASTGLLRPRRPT
jgi:hypothetical protein